MNTLQFILLAGGVITLLAGWLRWWRPKFRVAHRDVRAVKDSLLGREAVNDSITGRELSPAIPGIGQRMAVIEEAVAAIASNQTQMNHVVQEVDDLKGRVASLEAQELTRAMARTESIEMLRTIDTAIRSSPSDGHRENR